MSQKSQQSSRPPMQKRSRERYELILATAEDMLLQAGGDAFKMSDLVGRSGVPFGSLYQYFPDKGAVIGALAGRYNQVGRECVAAILDPVTDLDRFLSALDEVVDGFYQMFRDYPAMTPIWEATQADQYLKEVDRQDVEQHALMLADAYRRAAPGLPEHQVLTLSRLATELMACAVRHAITLDEAEARESLRVFKQGLKGFFVPASRAT